MERPAAALAGAGRVKLSMLTVRVDGIRWVWIMPLGS